MLEGFDWQPVLIAAIAILSLINGASVFQNYRTDKADIRIDPVYEDDWMYWSELKDPNGNSQVRRYVVVGYIGRSNIGRRPTSIAEATLKIRLRNRKIADSPLYDVPPPEFEMSSADIQRLPVMKPGPDPFDFRPMLHPGQSAAGIHCFLFGMYGADEWSPKSENGVLPATLILESGFGQTFKEELDFRFVEFASLERLFPSLSTFILDSLEAEPE